MKKLMVLFATVLVLVSCQSDKNIDDKSDQKQNETGEEQLDELLNLDKGESLFATLHTNMGEIKLRLYANDVPKTVKNFVGLGLKNYYDGVTFHRVIDDFMIQGGDPTGTGRGGESYYGGKFEDELKMHLKHDEAGVLSMANAGPNTNGSQFFITLKATPWLDGKHTVFGKVVSGMEVVRAIGNVQTNPQTSKPLSDVIIEDVTFDKTGK